MGSCVAFIGFWRRGWFVSFYMNKWPLNAYAFETVLMPLRDFPSRFLWMIPRRGKRTFGNLVVFSFHWSFFLSKVKKTWNTSVNIDFFSPQRSRKRSRGNTNIVYGGSKVINFVARAVSYMPSSKKSVLLQVLFNIVSPSRVLALSPSSPFNQSWCVNLKRLAAFLLFSLAATPRLANTKLTHLNVCALIIL